MWCAGSPPGPSRDRAPLCRRPPMHPQGRCSLNTRNPAANFETFSLTGCSARVPRARCEHKRDSAGQAPKRTIGTRCLFFNSSARFVRAATAGQARTVERRKHPPSADRCGAQDLHLKDFRLAPALSEVHERYKGGLGLTRALGRWNCHLNRSGLASRASYHGSRGLEKGGRGPPPCRRTWPRLGAP